MVVVMEQNIDRQTGGSLTIWSLNVHPAVIVWGRLKSFDNFVHDISQTSSEQVATGIFSKCAGVLNAARVCSRSHDAYCAPNTCVCLAVLEQSLNLGS